VAAPYARPTVRPSGWWYLAAAALAVLGLVLGGILVGRAFGDAQRAGFDASLVQAGEDQTLTILEPGGYTIAYSGPVIIYTVDDRRALIERLGIEIRPAGGGDPLPLGEYDGLNDLEQDGAQYVPLLTVRFDQAGDYVLTTAGAGLDPERSAIVVSESPFRKLREGVENALVVVAVTWLLAILGTVILARIRGRAKRALPPPPPPGWGGGPGPGGWPPPGQPQWQPHPQPQWQPHPQPQWPAPQQQPPQPQQWTGGGRPPGW
jgi:hypothetical protein